MPSVQLINIAEHLLNVFKSPGCCTLFKYGMLSYHSYSTVVFETLCKDLHDMCVTSSCRLYLQTKLANPHYKPEIAAQTTLVNFCVTEVGLEEQLLAQVVDHERPDLQEQARSLVRQLGEYTITLKELEDNLLQRLANSQV